MTQRQVAIGLQGVMSFGLLILIGWIISDPTLPLSQLVFGVVGEILSLVVLACYVRRVPYATAMLLTLATVVSAMVPPGPTLSPIGLLSLLIPPVIAVVIGAPSTVPVTFLAALLIYSARGSFAYPPGPVVATLLAMIIAGLTLARVVMDAALGERAAALASADAARREAAERAASLAEANSAQRQQIAEQEELLVLVATLETPVVPLAHGVLLAPLVGRLDQVRAAKITARLLADAHARRAKLVIIDITGVRAVDSAVARSLLSTARALRLIGCRVTLSGVVPEVALLLSSLDLPLGDIATVRSPQEALEEHGARSQK